MNEVYYKTVKSITSILMFVEGVKNAAYGEMVEIKLETGESLKGQVLDSREGLAVVQVFGTTAGASAETTKVRFTGQPAKIAVSTDMLGRVFDGTGNPRDGGPRIVSEKVKDVNGNAMNPCAREEPSEFIQTGISAIDGMNSLVRGQKLPIFSGSGMQHNKIAVQIARQAKLLNKNEKFAIVFCGMGIDSEEANFFKHEFEESGALDRTVMFLNLSSEPTMERLLLPRLALTTAEYLAFEEGMHILVIMTDMTNYCEALREVSSAREEVPGRRGYPGYMYTDLATIYERAGKIIGKPGSITQIPILTMPADDITHPIADLTGYINEGQIVLSRDLQRRGVYPNIDVLLSLSRLMNNGIGKDSTREDHRGLADELYAAYARGKDLRSLVAIVGEEALSKTDKEFLDLADRFESGFIGQGYDEDRKIVDTLSSGWDILSGVDIREIKRVREEFVKKYGKWKAGS